MPQIFSHHLLNCVSMVQLMSLYCFSEFELSDAQQEHALAVEHLAPTLAALRIELCPGHMSESHFWKIYFVLVHPRLDKHDAELLSTPEVQWLLVVSVICCFRQFISFLCYG